MPRSSAAGVLETALFDYGLPDDRIAQQPLAERDASRLLHLPRAAGAPEDRTFADLPALLQPGDLLVVNDTRVRAARLRTQSDNGGVIEVLVLSRLEGDRYACLVRPARRLKPGRSIDFGGELQAVVAGDAPGHPGARVVQFAAAGGDVDASIEHLGSVPLPPYIHGDIADARRYQTVFAAGAPESAAAPTAGLHFTVRILEALRDRGIEVASVRLDVGLGTFTPIRTARLDDHDMHAERYELPSATADAIARARQREGRVVAVGTTAVRTLETCARGDASRSVNAGSGSTSLFLRPGTPFRVVDGLLTNFHAPCSSLVVLVAAFVGVERWRSAYEHALRAGYRFLSFGDCMLCWRAAE